MKKLFNGTILAFALALVFATPTFAEGTTTQNNPQTIEPRAVEPKTTESETTKPQPIEPTFSWEASDRDDFARIRFGKNQLLAGNNLDVNTQASGLLFAFGNQLQLGTHSEYAFVAGNLVSYSATTEKDLFVAGNVIDLKSGAEIGRDVYATGFRVILASDLSGDFSAAANQVILRDVEIAGNVNLSAASISFEGTVSIAGTLTYNDDAQVYGLTNAKATKVETYTPATYEPTAAELWLSKVVSIISLALASIVVLALSSRVRNQVAGEKSTQSLGANLVAGFVALLLMPVIAIILLMSYFAAPLGIMVIIAYIAMLYLAQALAGAWLGHAIVSKLLHSQAHVFIEAIIGIIIIVILSMIPGLNVITSFLATLLGSGALIRAIKPGKTASEETSALVAERRKTLKQPTPTAKTTRNASTSTKTSAKSTSKTSAKPARKTTKKGQK